MPNDGSEFRDKPVVVLGAASGIGRATALAFAERGAKVAALDVKTDAFDGFADQLRKTGAADATTGAADVRTAASIKAGLDGAVAAFGGIDHFIYTAGILRVGPLCDIPEEDFDDVFTVNTRGYFLAVRAAVPLLRAGPSRRRSITGIASVAALRAKASSGIYSASKVAMARLINVFAVELAPHGITVNGIAPGTVETPMTAPFMQGQGQNRGYRLSGVSPLGRIAQPEDVAKACLYLSSAQADYVTGVILPVDGGTSAAMPPA